MVFRQALSETRAIQAEVPKKLVGNLSHSLCWKAFPQPLSEGYTIHNLASSNTDFFESGHNIKEWEYDKENLFTCLWDYCDQCEWEI